MDELFLLPAEQEAFSALPVELQKGWMVEREEYRFQDSSERQMLRFRMLRLRDPVFVSYRDRLVAATSPVELQSIVRTLDLSKIGNHEYTKLLFALGPDAMTLMISDAFETVQSKDDIEVIAALSGLRHLMLESLVEADF